MTDALDFPHGYHDRPEPQSLPEASERLTITTTETDPGRVQIAIYSGHGEHQKTVRVELSVGDMQHMHETLTEALWTRLRDKEKPPLVNGG